MAAKKTKPGYDYLYSALKSNRNAVYADVAAAAAKKGLTVYPIMWGRAKAALGLVKSKPRGQGKAATSKAKASGVKLPGRRGPGRPRKNVGNAFTGTIESIVAAVKSGEQEKARYRSALERIQSILADALS
ncbi:MAG: hypothetical protein U1E73_02800 [Planctomycetota bacterium]